MFVLTGAVTLWPGDEDDFLIGSHGFDCEQSTHDQQPNYDSFHGIIFP
jgi:hypothetical protein